MASPKSGSVSKLTMADKPRLSEEDVLDAIMDTFICDWEEETLQEFLNRMDDEAVLMLHEAIHKHFGG